MIAELGQFALVLALLISAIQAALPLYGAERGNAALIAVATIHACVFFLVRQYKTHKRREIYNWLQRICDDLVI